MAITIGSNSKFVVGGADPVGSGASSSIYKLHTAFINNPVSVAKNGFLYIYVSNESNLPVYFDNRVATHIPGAILEETHYYPFGLTMAGISSKAITFGSPENKFKYNGKEEQKEEFADGIGLDWLDYGARMYDAQIGRWHIVDPLLERTFTVYSYCSNDPVNKIDPDGNADIYTRRGKWIGTDGVDDNIAFIAKGRLKRQIKRNTKDGNNWQDGLAEGKKLVRVATGDARDAVINTIDETRKDNREHGGHVETNGEIHEWAAGNPFQVVERDDEGNPIRVRASITPYNGIPAEERLEPNEVEMYWHTHPSGKVNGVNIGSHEPSEADYRHQTNMRNGGFMNNAFLISTNTNRVTFYNRKKIMTIRYSVYRSVGLMNRNGKFHAIYQRKRNQKL